MKTVSFTILACSLATLTGVSQDRNPYSEDFQSPTEYISCALTATFTPFETNNTHCTGRRP